RRGYPLRTAAVDEHDQEHSPQNPAIVLHTMAASAYLTPGILAVLPHGIRCHCHWRHIQSGRMDSWRVHRKVLFGVSWFLISVLSCVSSGSSPPAIHLPLRLPSTALRI